MKIKIQRRKVIFLMVFIAVTLSKENIITVQAANFLLSQSATRYLEMKDVSGFSQQKLNYARNEIYARHGRKFKSQELMDFFNATDWYEGTISPEAFDENMLNDYERANADFLREIEYENAPDGYVLDMPGYDISAVWDDNISGAILTQQQAYDAVYKYLDDQLNMDTVYDYQGYLIYADNEEEEYVFQFRSYTSAHAYYYVNAFTGDVYVSQENPIISVYEERKFVFNALGIETEASTSEKPKYELMLEDNTYFTSMLSATNGNPDGYADSIQPFACDYSYSNLTFFVTGSWIRGEWREDLQMAWPTKCDEEHYLQNKVRGFVCNADTQFIALSGEDFVTNFSPEEFVEYAIQCKDTNLSLKIEVKNGVASLVEISS